MKKSACKAISKEITVIKPKTFVLRHEVPKEASGCKRKSGTAM
jgi:hypothetical protein